MVLDIETAGALIPGRTLVRKEVNVQMQKVKILRTFIGLPKDAKIGSILTIPKALAIQAKDAGKVEFLPEEPKASSAKSPSTPLDESKSEAEAEPKSQVKEKPKKF